MNALPLLSPTLLVASVEGGLRSRPFVSCVSYVAEEWVVAMCSMSPVVETDGVRGK